MSTWPELHAGTNFNYVWDVNTLAWIREEPSAGGGGSTTIITDGSSAGQADVMTSQPTGSEEGLVVRQAGPVVVTGAVVTL